MIFFLEIGMLLIGLISLIWRDVPNWFFGGSGYRIPDQTARLLGMVLLLPIPLTALTGFLYSLIIGEGFQRYAFWLELITVLATMAVAIRIAHISRKSIEPLPGEEIIEESKIEKRIRRKSESARIYATLVGLGLPAIAFFPVAMRRVDETLALINDLDKDNPLITAVQKARRDAILLVSLWIIAFMVIGVLSM